MDEMKTVAANDISTENFMKPRCPVKIGDRFYRNYRVQNSLNPVVVTAVEDRGDYYVITGRHLNTAVGNREQKYDSRMISKNDDYTILKKGVDF